MTKRFDYQYKFIKLAQVPTGKFKKAKSESFIKAGILKYPTEKTVAYIFDKLNGKVFTRDVETE